MKLDTNEPSKLVENVRNFLSQQLKINIEPKAVNKIGEKMCIVECQKEADKEKIMANKAKLKERKEERVFINNDMTKKEREKQKEIRMFAKLENQKGKEVKMGYNKVSVNGQEWRWDKETNRMKILEKIHPKN